ncbi:MAG: ATP-binding cassette domain-containing protein [Actinomycetota bacterium]|nr:ATP-binding cassette domain-containing protein [Actinomycetota bacterium]
MTTRAGRTADPSRSPKWAAAALLPAVNRRRAAALALLVLLTGFLPVGIIFATGVVVGSIPDTLGEGLGADAGGRALRALGVLGLSFVVLQAASAARAAVGSALGWDLNRHLEQRVMAAVASPAGIGHLEDSSSLEQIAAARDVVFAGYRPCDAVPAMATRATGWCQGIGAALVLATYRWWLAVIVAAAWGWRARVLKRQHLRGATAIGVRAPAARRSEYLRDLALTPGAAKEVRVFGVAGWLIGRFRHDSTRVLKKAASERNEGKTAVWASTASAIAASLLAYVVVGVAAARGDLDLRGLALCVGAIAGIQVLVHIGLDNLLLELGTVPVPAVAALEEAMDRSAPGGITPAPEAPGDAVCFEGVHFTYPGTGHAVLSGLDLTLPAGRSVAIVGANGAGKTTLVKLLCRFYEPDAGLITVDGHDLQAFDARAWQRRVAAVFQDFVRYPLSAADNFSFGSTAGSSGEGTVEAAARRAGIFDTLAALPQGFDTVLAPQHAGGTDLSGGQWQRVVLARALFAAEAGARILVLDEPAANLDARGEADLYERFLDITRGVTTVVISHRFSTVRRADLIYVLEHGRVAEKGSHDELMAAGGLYARMFTVQAARLTGVPVEDAVDDR